MGSKRIIGIVGSIVVFLGVTVPSNDYFNTSLVETSKYGKIAIVIAILAGVSFLFALFETKLLWISTPLTTAVIVFMYFYIDDQGSLGGFYDIIWVLLAVGNVSQYISSAMIPRYPENGDGKGIVKGTTTTEEYEQCPFCKEPSEKRQSLCSSCGKMKR